MLEGEPRDWELIEKKAKAFRDYELDWWADSLDPILGHFVKASHGDPDREFWSDIYQHHDVGSGTPYTTDWLGQLYPYLGEDYERNPFIGNDKARRYGPELADFPPGPASAPFTWHYLGEQLDMEFLGGLMGVSFDPDTLRVKPEFAWAVRRWAPRTRDQDEESRQCLVG